MSSTEEEQPWHASPALLVAYSLGRARPADAWSAEAHLATCGACRAELARVVAQDDDDHRLLALARQRVLSTPPRQAETDASKRVEARARTVLARAGAPWHVRWVARPASLGAVALAVAAATAFAGLTHVVVGPGGGTGWLLWLLAPALPAVGVALSALGAGPEREVELATPSAGWRLVLWRTLAVVLAAVPLALVAGLLVTASTGPAPAQLLAGTPGVSGAWLPVLWLLPALALTATALALGTWLPLRRAAALVGAGWVLAVLGLPALLLDRAPQPPADGTAPAGVPGAVGAVSGGDGAWALHLLSGWAQPVWLLLLAAALAVVVVRREAFGEARSAGATGSWWREGGGEA